MGEAPDQPASGWLPPLGSRLEELNLHVTHAGSVAGAPTILNLAHQGGYVKDFIVRD